MVERVLSTVWATTAPEMVRGPREPVTTTSSITTPSAASVPEDWAEAAPASSMPLTKAVVAQSARVREFIVYPQMMRVSARRAENAAREGRTCRNLAPSTSALGTIDDSHVTRV